MCFVIAAFFKKTQVKNSHHLKVKGPVIIAMNHPNAFMDPIAFTTLVYPPRLFYLARGDAFKKGIISKILESFGIIPIFRIQDAGKEGLKKNNETYERVNALLKKNKKIIIFAEGICIQERRLRPLKKGVPRMVFGAVESQNIKDLLVIPVGLNYSAPSFFRSKLFCNIGEPIKISEYLEQYQSAPAKTMNQFLADLYPKMKELIVHIHHPGNEKIIEHIEYLYKSEYFKKNNLNPDNLEHDFIFSDFVTKQIEKVQSHEQSTIDNIETKTSDYISKLESLNLKDWLFDSYRNKTVNWSLLLLRFFLLLIAFPIYFIGLLGNYIPYKLSAYIVDKKVKLVEFKASFAMGIGAFAFLLYYSIQLLMIQIFSPNIWITLSIILCFILSGTICLYLSPFRKKTFGIYRLLVFKKTQFDLFQKINEERNIIIKQIEAILMKDFKN
jgi:1-acyl-sn-glycerol-3-phosphate acyltransferase